MKQKIILDVDPGVDDSISMIYSFLSPSLDVKLICVTKGNRDLKQSTLNALFIVENFAKQPVPVVQGSCSSLKQNDVPLLNVHGKSGLGDLINITNVSSSTINKQGYGFEEAIFDYVKKYDDIIYVCNGPCSSLAKAIQKYPEILQKLKKVLIMGGTYSGIGSITPYASFNMYCDPDATQIILNSIEYVRFSPSEIGLSVFLNKQLLDKWSRYGKYGSIVKKLYTGYRDLLMPTDKLATHDLCSIMTITNPEFFQFKNVDVKINTTFSKKRGQTIFKDNPNSKHTLAWEADREKIVKHFDKLLKKAK